MRKGMCALVFIALFIGSSLIIANPQVFGKEVTLRATLTGGKSRSIDPHWAATGQEMYAVYHMYSGLVQYATNGKIEPDLAESWKANEDNTVWTFKLRKGVQWQGGYGELTADDVKWSFERVMDPKVGSPFKGDYSNVSNIKVNGKQEERND